jgi:hypothetical protein
MPVLSYTPHMPAQRCIHFAPWCRVVAALLALACAQPAFSWGRHGHEIVNGLAQSALTPDVPAFLRNGSAHDAMVYFAPEPDRWGSPLEPQLRNAQEPDHFLSMEWSDLIGELPMDRYDYVRALASQQPAHPGVPLRIEDVGAQPYQVNELYQRLRVAFRQYRMLQAANRDTAPVEGEIVFLAGWLGHYVGDGSQPLHLTYRYNGWIGDNPHHYDESHHIHAQFEGTFVEANMQASDVAPLVNQTPALLTNVFGDYLTYLRRSRDLYEQVYRFQQQGALDGAGTDESRGFTRQRLAAGATELRDLIYTAWIRSGDPLPKRPSHG